MFGRISIGYLGGLKKFNRLYLYAIVLTLAGVASMLEPFFSNYIGFLIYSIVFGYFSGKANSYLFYLNANNDSKQNSKVVMFQLHH